MKIDKINIFPKEELLMAWENDKRRFTSDAAAPPLYLRCGKLLNPHLTVNAFSRALSVYICEDCGIEEALSDWSENALPLREWYAVKESCVPVETNDCITLTPVNPFRHIFEGPQKQMPGYGGSRPVSEVAYSRSDYDGRKWWTTWHHMQENKVPPEQAQEIDSIMDSLLALPEFQNLRALRRACALYAGSTGEPTEFNLYGESPNFYLWLRLITREKDYNLYVHFYDKNIYENETPSCIM